MAEINFEVSSRNETSYLTTVTATAGDMKLTLYMETETGNICYPVMIEKAVPCIVFMLDSDSMASCSVPPSIPEALAESFADGLYTAHDVVSAARKLVEEEQDRLKKGKNP